MPSHSTLDKFREPLAKRKNWRSRPAVGHETSSIGSTTIPNYSSQTNGISHEHVRLISPNSSPLAEPETSASEVRHEYEYERIDSPFIRLIELQSGNWTDPIECTLSTFDLNTVDLPDDSPYETLSYVWGDVSHRREIYIKGVPFNVTRSLFEALQVLRCPAGGGARIVWADGICINQNDQEEKTIQVQMMGRIYACGAKVLIWLGHFEPVQALLNLDMLCLLAAEEDGTESSSSGLLPETSSNGYGTSGTTHLRQFPTEQETPPEFSAPHYRWYSDDRSRSILVTPDPHTTDISFHKPDSLKHICPLFETAWFQRIWVIQEYIKSTSTEVLWGNASFSFDLLGKAVTSLRGYHYSKVAHYTTASSGINSCYDIYCMKRDDGTTNTFFKTLLLTKDRKATDPRDKIFALVELPFSDRGDDNFFPLAPDYSLDVANIYRTTARRLLLERKEIDILAYVKPGSPLADTWASWVPDWTHCRSSNALAGRKVSAYTPPVVHEPRCRFCATERFDSISVGGIVVDTVEYLAADIFDRKPSAKSYGFPRLSRQRKGWLHAINAFINHFQGTFEEMTVAKSLTAGGGAHLAVLEGEDEEAAFTADYREFVKYAAFLCYEIGDVGARASEGSGGRCCGGVVGSFSAVLVEASG
ncbi:Heterokaryon incompatibility protein HET [Pyrenophora tritici-repentis]|nr:het domain-containing protein [Pyrenophora tritici-repentis]KAI1582109.1 het domain-containing protein [Pyrenophora tritici-repentis]KAI1590153.1 het domain-containing protein [Pyrenophora tritici-repentis]KAI1664308.1 Heterokaryon incompatibility protein HET [Pyrenophora tritici-repentis]